MTAHDIHLTRRRRAGRAAAREPVAEPRPVKLPRVKPQLSIGARPHGLSAGELVKLHHALIETLSFGSGVIAQFVAPQRDAAITHVVYDLAYVGASWLEKRVLFVNGTDMEMDAAEPRRSVREEPKLTMGFDPAALERAISRVIGLELYQLTLPSMRDALDLAPALKRIPEFIERVRTTFDLVVIASPSAAEAPLGVLLAPFVDGNVLVLESGRTRAPVAADLQRSLETAGGSVAGVVLTDCHTYAPRWLRRWL